MKEGKPEFVGPRGRDGGPPRLKVPRLPALGGRAKGCLAVAIVLLVVCGALYSMFLEYVRPDEFGIKEVQVGVNRGIQEHVYKPGLAFVMPFGFQRMHRLPRNLQVLELTTVAPRSNSAAYADSVYRDDPVKIQTSDGFYVDADVSILYRIVDPYRVVTTLGPGDQFLTQGMLPKAVPFLKQSLGKLTTEEFYNSPLRVEKAEEARDLLNEEMHDKGIQVEHVLVRYFRYSDVIQQNIEDKKLQDQLVETNKSKSKAAQAEQELNRVREQGEVDVKLVLEEGNAYRVEREADKELYVRKKEADADLLVELAEAKRTELRNEAMRILGADRMVAMEMAAVLEGLEVILLPSGGPASMNPFDLEAVLDTFGVHDYATQERAPSTERPKWLSESEIKMTKPEAVTLEPAEPDTAAEADTPAPPEPPAEPEGPAAALAQPAPPAEAMAPAAEDAEETETNAEEATQ